MSTASAKLSAVPHGRETVDTIRNKVVQFRAAALPRAASAAENAGEAVSKLALSTSKNVAGALRKHKPDNGAKIAAMLPMYPLLRTAARFAARNPAVLALAGVGIAALGYAAWRRQRAADTGAEVEPAPEA